MVLVIGEVLCLPNIDAPALRAVLLSALKLLSLELEVPLKPVG